MSITKNHIIFILTLGVLGFVFFFFVTVTWIGYSVQDKCQQAESEYNQDCVNSLMLMIDDPDVMCKDKNNAIWALGQLGDDRALEFLQSKYSGSVPEGRESLDQDLSQYELSKAIKLLEGGFNLGAWVWR